MPWPTVTQRSVEPATAIDSSAALPSASPGGCARDAGSDRWRPGASVCEPCGEKRNSASRARDAKLRAAGKPRRDPERARTYERKRDCRVSAERAARGLCTRCGKAPAVEGRSACKPCLEKRRSADRDRYTRGQVVGLPYGGANADAKRRSGRAKSKRRQQARREAGPCIRCGARPPIEGGTTCVPCRDKRQAAERQQYAERRAAGLCTRCGGPVFDGLSRYGPCAVIDEASRSPGRKNAQSRNRYAAAERIGKTIEAAMEMSKEHVD